MRMLDIRCKLNKPLTNKIRGSNRHPFQFTRMYTYVKDSKIRQISNTYMPAILNSKTRTVIQMSQLKLALQLQHNGELSQAQAIYQNLLKEDPANHHAWHLSGLIEIQLKNYMSAIHCFLKAIQFQTKSAQYYRSLGLALHEMGKHKEAIVNFEWAILIDPQNYEAHYNRGNTYVAIGKFDLALSSYQESIKINPKSPNALYNCGIALQNQRQFRAAIEYYDAALALKPQYPEAQRNKALSLLYLGDYELGFELFESRWLRQDFTPPASTIGKPKWLGKESVAGKTILLHSEQGLGDSIQFSRYASLVANLGAKVILEVDRPLLNLFTSLQGVSAVYVKGDVLPEFDYHCPFLSLPLAFKTNASTVPRQLRYLHSEPNKLRYWGEKLGPRSGIRIGIAWSGGEAYAADQTRSISLSEFLAELPICFEYISLQKDVRESDQQVLKQRPDIKHFGNEQRDFSDTAAIIDHLDLIISVDTSVGHLSAALGKPTATLLSYLGDWRWISGMDQSPWYPNTKLFRQDKPGDWPSAFSKLRAALFSNFFGARNSQ